MRTKVFISYSRSDRRFLEELKEHLVPLERQGIIDRWDDTRLEAGQDWRKEIRQAIAEATVAVLLISRRFLASKFIVENELPPLLEAAEKDGLVVLPVIISPSRFEQEERLSNFQAANDPEKTLQELSPAARDRIWLELTLKIERTLATPQVNQTRRIVESTMAEVKPDFALDEAREWLAEGDYDRAHEIATAALIKARQNQEIDDQVDALVMLARSGVYDDIQEVQDLFEEALSLSEQSGVKDKSATSLLALAAIEIDFEAFGKAQKAIDRSRKIYSQLGDLDGMARTLMTESLIYRRQYQYDKERTLLEHARDLFRQNKNRAGEGKTLVHLSQAYPEVSTHPKTGEVAFGVDGKKEMEEALAVFELANDDSLAAIAASGLAFKERNLGEFENARQYFVRAVKLCQQSKSFNMQAKFLADMGDMEVQTSNLQNAVEAYQEAVLIPQHEARGYWKAGVLVKLGDAKRALGDGAGAGEAYQEAKNISEKMNYNYGRALALEGLAETAADSDRARAKRLLYQAAQLFAESGYENKEHQVRKRAGEIDA